MLLHFVQGPSQTMLHESMIDIQISITKLSEIFPAHLSY